MNKLFLSHNFYTQEFGVTINLSVLEQVMSFWILSKRSLSPSLFVGEEKFHQDFSNLNISNETFYDGLSVKAATGHRWWAHICGGG